MRKLYFEMRSFTETTQYQIALLIKDYEMDEATATKLFCITPLCYHQLRGLEVNDTSLSQEKRKKLADFIERMALIAGMDSKQTICRLFAITSALYDEMRIQGYLPAPVEACRD